MVYTFDMRTFREFVEQDMAAAPSMTGSGAPPSPGSDDPNDVGDSSMMNRRLGLSDQEAKDMDAHGESLLAPAGTDFGHEYISSEPLPIHIDPNDAGKEGTVQAMAMYTLVNPRMIVRRGSTAPYEGEIEDKPIQLTDSLRNWIKLYAWKQAGAGGGAGAMPPGGAPPGGPGGAMGAPPGGPPGMGGM